MANSIQNNGRWGPIVEGNAKSWEGRQIVMDFATSTAAINYTGTFEVPVSTETEFVWNTEAVDCADTADMQIMWQGTDDPSVGGVDLNGLEVSAADTGWTTVEIMDLNGSAKCDARTTVNLSGVASVVNKAYMRLKFILSTASPGTVSITCRLINLPTAAKVTHNTAL